MHSGRVLVRMEADPEVRRVCQVPPDRLANLWNGDHRRKYCEVVDRKNPKEAADVEDLCRSAHGLVSRFHFALTFQQDTGDEESAEDEELPDGQTPPFEVAKSGLLRDSPVF